MSAKKIETNSKAVRSRTKSNAQEVKEVKAEPTPVVPEGKKVGGRGRVFEKKVGALGEEKVVTGPVDMRLDPHVRDKMRTALIAGNTYESASISAGISYSTFNRWMKQGRDAKEGTLAREFYDLVRSASNTAEARNVMCIQKAAKTTWQAAAWWLERRRAEAYGRRDVVNVSENHSFEDNAQEGSMSDDEKRATLKAMLRIKPDLLDPKTA
jgi:hypothetical protein